MLSSSRIIAVLALHLSRNKLLINCWSCVRRNEASRIRSLTGETKEIRKQHNNRQDMREEGRQWVRGESIWAVGQRAQELPVSHASEFQLSPHNTVLRPRLQVTKLCETVLEIESLQSCPDENHIIWRGCLSSGTDTGHRHRAPTPGTDTRHPQLVFTA